VSTLTTLVPDAIAGFDTQAAFPAMGGGIFLNFSSRIS
jgi:hypothetical protein